MAEQKQDDQLEHTFSNYVRIWDVVQKTCRRRWMIGKSGERGSGISVLPARHDDDDWFSWHSSCDCYNSSFNNWIDVEPINNNTMASTYSSKRKGYLIVASTIVLSEWTYMNFVLPSSSSLSSWRRTDSTDSLYSLSPSVPIGHQSYRIYTPLF